MSRDISSRYDSDDNIKARLGEVDVLHNQVDENGYMSQRQLQYKDDTAFSPTEKVHLKKKKFL